MKSDELLNNAVGYDQAAYDLLMKMTTDSNGKI